MPKTFKRGDHVEWNSEAGRVRGVITEKVVSDVRFKGYVHHATKDEPQYFIKSDKTDHIEKENNQRGWQERNIRSTIWFQAANGSTKAELKRTSLMALQCLGY
jgi:hypothetical protein